MKVDLGEIKKIEEAFTNQLSNFVNKHQDNFNRSIYDCCGVKLPQEMRYLSTQIKYWTSVVNATHDDKTLALKVALDEFKKICASRIELLTSNPVLRDELNQYTDVVVEQVTAHLAKSGLIVRDESINIQVAEADQYISPK